MSLKPAKMLGLRMRDNKLHIKTCCDFFIYPWYLKENSKKYKKILPRNEEKNLVFGLKNRGSTYTRDQLIHGKMQYHYTEKQ